MTHTETGTNNNQSGPASYSLLPTHVTAPTLALKAPTATKSREQDAGKASTLGVFLYICIYECKHIYVYVNMYEYRYIKMYTNIYKYM